MRISEHNIKIMIFINILKIHENKRPCMTSTTEIASQVVEELDKSSVSCDKKGRAYSKKAR